MTSRSSKSIWTKLKHKFRRLRGKGHTVEELARRLGKSVEELKVFQPAYHKFSRPKKRGGVREITAPNTETKQLQRIILHRLLAKLKVHSSAIGYRKGLSVADNALPHLAKAVVIKADIKDFFPNTSAERVFAYFHYIGWDKEAAELLTRLVTYEGGLPQGAPTSPFLSNALNYRMDTCIDAYVSEHKGFYTRYADDITVSYHKDYPKYIRGTLQVIKKQAKRQGYTIHTDKKLSVVRAHKQQRVTGLVVNSRLALPREKRRWLRAVEHRLRTQGKASLTEQQLKGWKAYQQMIRNVEAKYLDS